MPVTNNQKFTLTLDLKVGQANSAIESVLAITEKARRATLAAHADTTKCMAAELVTAKRLVTATGEERTALLALQKEQQAATDAAKRREKERAAEQAKAEKALRKAQLETRGYREVLETLSASKPKEIRQAIKEINAEMESDSVKRGSARWNELNDKLRQCREELKGIKDESKSASPTAMDGLREQWGNAFSLEGLKERAAGLLTPDSVLSAASAATRAYADMDAAMADVRKYTGLTREEVEGLNEEFKRMDTRTTRAALNELAGAAGRLGITSREGILEFVDASDKISTALGDDLGSGAVDSIGKLAQMFGEADNLGLRGAMLATGSAVNDLAQSSSANAGYMVDFAADLSGVAAQAGMTQTQLFGLASALDQNMQEEKTSATVFSQLITKMFQDPAKFAELAGRDVAEFTALLKQDANEALLQFMQSMQGRGGFDQLAPVFEGMGLAGTRAVGVLSSVATHLDQVREAQQLAADSYKAGTSVLDEFDVQNSTVQAKLEKVGGALLDVAIELGGTLWPVVSTGTSLLQVAASALSAIIGFVRQHIVLVATLSASYAAWTGVLTLATAKAALHTAATKLQVFWSGTLVTSLKAVRAALMANPWTAAITLALSAAAAIYEFARGSKAAAEASSEQARQLEAQRKATEAVADVKAKAATAAADEKAKIAQLTDIIHSNTYSVEQRRRAVEALRGIIPSYNALISDEGNITRENTSAIDEYIKKLDQLALAKAVADKKEEIARKKVDLQVRQQRVEGSIKAVNAYRSKNADKMGTETAYYTTSAGAPMAYERSTAEETRTANELHAHRQRLAAIEAENKALDAQDAALDKIVGKDAAVKEAVVAAATAATAGKAGKAGTAPSAGKAGRGGGKATDESSLLKQAYDDDQAALDLSLRHKELSEDDYYKRSLALAAKYYADLQALQAESGKPTDKLRLQAEEAAGKITTQHLQRVEQAQKAALDADLAADQLSADGETTEAARKYLEGQTTYEQYQEQLDRIAYEHARRRALIMDEYGADSSSEWGKVTQMDVASKQKNDAAVAERSASDKAASLKGYEADLSGASSLGQKNALLQQMYESDLITYEDYESRKTQAAEQAAQARTAAAQQGYQQVTQLMSAASSYYAAQSSYEQALVSKKYDAEIEKAGANTKKGKKLEEQKQKEQAAIKTKYAKKQMKMEIAQAIAQGAMAAINAYNCGVSVGGPWGVALGVAFAAAAAVQTGIQIATIKKQHQAEEAGYYSGGYTGGTNYRRRAGIVHEGEFVVNHEALQNPAIAPVVAMLDEAQRNGTATTLTAEDVSATLPATAAQTLAMPTQTAEAMAATLSAQPSATSPQPAAAADTHAAELASAIAALNDQLSQGIRAVAAIDGPDGVYKQLKHFERLNK